MIFSAYDIRGKADEPGSVEYIWNVGKAFSEWLPDEGSVLVVRTETGSASTVHTFTEGVVLQGRNVIDGGAGDTSRIIGIISEKKAVGAALIDRNDLQAVDIITFYDRNGVSITADNGLREIGELVESGNFLPAPTKGEVTKLE